MVVVNRHDKIDVVNLSRTVVWERVHVLLVIGLGGTLSRITEKLTQYFEE